MFMPMAKVTYNSRMLILDMQPNDKERRLTDDLNDLIESAMRASCGRLFHKEEEEGTIDE